MKKLNLSVDSTRSLGAMRKILGINNSPTINFLFNTEIEQKLFDALNPAYVRYHDAALENPGYTLIDVSRIFPLFHLDENDPRNYNFGPTDEYLALTAESGATIDFRLGETIELSKTKYRVNPPADFEKWARICVNIIRHYTEGWANGFHYDSIKYLSIWEEPNNPSLFFGEYSDYLRLFVTAYKALKAAFPAIKVGGPNAMNFSFEHCEEYLAYAKENGVTPDFISGNFYTQDADWIVSHVNAVAELLKKHDCPNTEIIITEWHLCPDSWAFHIEPKFATPINAAFTALALIRLLDTPVTAAYYYAWKVGTWTVVQVHPTKGLVTLPVYHALQYFSELSQCAERVSVSGLDDEKNIAATAGLDGSKLTLLFSCFEEDSFDLTISVPGYNSGRYKMISNEDGEQSEAWHDLDRTADGTFTVSADDCGMRVLLMTFEIL